MTTKQDRINQNYVGALQSLRALYNDTNAEESKIAYAEGVAEGLKIAINIITEQEESK